MSSSRAASYDNELNQRTSVDVTDEEIQERFNNRYQGLGMSFVPADNHVQPQQFTCYICDMELLSSIPKYEKGIYRCKCGNTLLDNLSNHIDRYIGLPPKESPMFLTIYGTSSDILTRLKKEWNEKTRS